MQSRPPTFQIGILYQLSISYIISISVDYCVNIFNAAGRRFYGVLWFFRTFVKARDDFDTTDGGRSRGPRRWQLSDFRHPQRNFIIQFIFYLTIFSLVSCNARKCAIILYRRYLSAHSVWLAKRIKYRIISLLLRLYRGSQCSNAMAYLQYVFLEWHTTTPPLFHPTNVPLQNTIVHDE